MKTIYLLLLASILFCGCSTNHNEHNHSFDDGHDHEMHEGFDNNNTIDSSQQYFSIEGDSTIQMK